VRKKESLFLAHACILEEAAENFVIDLSSSESDLCSGSEDDSDSEICSIVQLSEDKTTL
jgi:hypothetical protein